MTASFVVPRFVPNPEGGFASGSSAVLVLLLMLFAALLSSLLQSLFETPPACRQRPECGE